MSVKGTVACYDNKLIRVPTHYRYTSKWLKHRGLHYCARRVQQYDGANQHRLVFPHSPGLRGDALWGRAPPVSIFPRETQLELPTGTVQTRETSTVPRPA